VADFEGKYLSPFSIVSVFFCMNNLSRMYWVSVCLMFAHSTLAQTNYVATVPNSANPPGLYNTLVGPGAGNATMTGSVNVFIGSSAGHLNTTGYSNAVLGFSAGSANTIGHDNAFMGYNSGNNNTKGNLNTFIGAQAGTANTTGGSNTSLGFSAGYKNMTGYSNQLVGVAAGYTNTTGSYNVLLGDSAGFYTTVSNCLFVGSKAGFFNATGKRSTYLGYQAGYNALADSNTFVGHQAGYNTTSGIGNTFFGVYAGRNISTGSHNTIMGNQAGPAALNSDDNVYIGYHTGQQDRGSRNTFIGTLAGILPAINGQPLINATALGADALVSISNAVVLGNQANVGIGTSAPMARLEVVSETDQTSGLRLTRLTTASQPTQATDQFLTVTEQGDVVKARYLLRINNVTEWSDKVFSGTYQLRPLSLVARYIQQHGHLPGIPSAGEVVRDGVSLATFQSALLEKVEELTLYSIELETQNHRQSRVLQAQRQQLERLEKRQGQLEQLLQQVLKRK
jgi:hypothetical protein